MQKGWSLRQVDIKAGFLNGDIDSETFVSHPINLPTDLQKSCYYRLYTALYRLHQVPLEWYEKLRQILVSKLEFRELNSAASVFLRPTKIGGESSRILVLCDVDDILFAGDWKEELENAVKELLNHFEGHSEESLSWYLGVKIEFNAESCKVSQPAYISRILQEYKLQDVKIYETPMSSNFYAELERNKKEPVLNSELYSSMIGSLIFLANHTPPDISTMVGVLSQFSVKPTRFLMKQLVRVCGYIRGTARTQKNKS